MRATGSDESRPHNASSTALARDPTHHRGPRSLKLRQPQARRCGVAYYSNSYCTVVYRLYSIRYSVYTPNPMCVRTSYRRHLNLIHTRDL